MDELLDDETKKLYAELQKLLEEQKNIDELKNVLDKLHDRESNLQKELERALELFKKMKFEFTINAWEDFEYWIETDIVAEIPNCFFHLQIEKRNLKSNVDKFKKLGFTHALLIPNDLQYDEPTYAVMKSSNQISQSILLEEVA